MPDGDFSELPDLDYAYLAEYARVDPVGTLSVIGASFTEVTGVRFPASMAVYIAGRLRMAEGADPTQLTIRFNGPTAQTPRVEVGAAMAPDGLATYRGRVGVLFTVGMNVPLVEPGLQEFVIRLGDREVRTLRFNAAA